MSQAVPKPDGPLRPHYAFMVEKSKSSMGSKNVRRTPHTEPRLAESAARPARHEVPTHLPPPTRTNIQERLIIIDLLERKMHSFKKDKEKKEFPLSALADVKAAEGSKAKALELTINFKEKGKAYYIRCRAQEQYETMLVVLRRITGASDVEDDAALGLLLDDASSPPSSVHKSKVIKRAEKMGGSFAHDWQPRFMVMGTTQLMIFRDVELQHIVNIIPLSLLTLTPDAKDETCFQLSTSFWKASFRVITAEVAVRWKTALAELKRPAPPGIKRGPSRPSVIYNERDMANFHAELPSAPKGKGKRGFTPSLAPMLSEDSPVLLALPAPELAEADADLPGGWLQYSTDGGMKYYYNPATNETTWTPPEGIAITAPDVSDPPQLQRVESMKISEGEDARKAQMEALREAETEAPPSAASLAEAKGKLLKEMHRMERSLLKARRGIEADRPMRDLAPILDGLRASFDKLGAFGADYERKVASRDTAQDEFIQSKAAYLDGLQKHAFGDAEPSAVAGKIFRKCAYVADTFNPRTTHQHTLL
jgi:hypothetical protein